MNHPHGRRTPGSPASCGNVAHQGYLALILHAHLPFVKHPTHEDVLEEHWLFEAITETYLPLLFMLEGLVRDRIPFRLTLSLSPPLIAMLSDPLLRSRYLTRLERLIELGRREIRRTRGHPGLNSLAARTTRHLLRVRRAFLEIWRQDLVGAFRAFVETGHLEIMACAATHGYLPLLAVNASSVRAQVKGGIACCENAFGTRPGGFWLPECGYYPGVDKVLRDFGIRWSILETHGVTRAEPRPRFGIHAPITCPSGLAVFGRDPEASQQVWSATVGYPGDSDYREFYRDIAYDLDAEYLKPFLLPDGTRLDTGFKYHRITGGTDRKEIYLPEQAARKADLHAQHFLSCREEQFRRLSPAMDRKPLVAAPYDAELFGHWWHEGPIWLDRLIRRAAAGKSRVRFVTLSEYLDEYPVNQAAIPCTSSWGSKGFHETWLNGKTDWIYPLLHETAATMESLAARHPRAQGLERRALNQAARELLLAQASDWAFMIHHGNMADYATRRIRTHLSRFRSLQDALERGAIDETHLADIEYRDNILPELDYRWFKLDDFA